MLGLTNFVALVAVLASVVGAVPTPDPEPVPAPAAANAATYWVSDIKRQGAPAFGASGYKVFRNVKDYGAKG